MNVTKILTSFRVTHYDILGLNVILYVFSNEIGKQTSRHSIRKRNRTISKFSSNQLLFLILFITVIGRRNVT